MHSIFIFSQVIISLICILKSKADVIICNFFLICAFILHVQVFLACYFWLYKLFHLLARGTDRSSEFNLTRLSLKLTQVLLFL